MIEQQEPEVTNFELYMRHNLDVVFYHNYRFYIMGEFWRDLL